MIIIVLIKQEKIFMMFAICRVLTCMSAFVGILDTIEIWQFFIWQKRLCNGCIKTSCYTTALSWLVLKCDFYSVYSHWCSSTSSPKVIVQLPHGLLNKKISIPIHLLKHRRVINSVLETILKIFYVTSEHLILAFSW